MLILILLFILFMLVIFLLTLTLLSPVSRRLAQRQHGSDAALLWQIRKLPPVPSLPLMLRKSNSYNGFSTPGR